jgi:hypothetical protein
MYKAKLARGHYHPKHFSYARGFVLGLTAPIMIFSTPTLSRFTPISTAEAMSVDWQAVGGDLLQATENLIDEQIEKQEEEPVEA